MGPDNLLHLYGPSTTFPFINVHQINLVYYPENNKTACTFSNLILNSRLARKHILDFFAFLGHASRVTHIKLGISNF